jgi:23S rRNA (guanosine2251-2'-O)-methyltransferase
LRGGWPYEVGVRLAGTAVIVYGIHPVREAMRAGTVERLLVAQRSDERLRDVLDLAAAGGIRVDRVDRAALDRVTRCGVHQGVAARLRSIRGWSVEGLLAAAAAPPLFLVLDGVEDPHNLGAILRSCDAAGVDGVVRQTRRAAPLTGAVAKASAGAVAHLRVADVVNIARALEALKRAGIWVVGLTSEASRSYDHVDLTVPVALVVGGEGTGLRRLVKASCDWLVKIPMRGQVESLNVSVAAGVVLFEARRQRAATAGSRST